jgi:exodeoxyribonuclease VII small subunit
VAKKKSSDVELCFEDALKELEAIVGKLEGGKLGLEESLEQYEQGVQHLKQCYQQLRHAERRIELVSGLDATGKVQSVPFDEEDEDSLATKGEARGRRRTATGNQAIKRPTASEVDDESSLF